LIAISAQEESTLVQQADHALTFTVDEEGCPLGLAPMASTTATLAIGDALAAAIMERKHFSAQDFARFHPGGKLGHALLKISDVMHAGQEKPLVAADSTLEKALLEMTEKRLGMTVVFLAEKTYGLLSDGDIRRLLQQQGSLSLQRLAGEVCTRNPRTLREDQLAVEALNVMETHHITSVVILNRQGHYVGVVHLHDLWKTQMI
jgi:arabinose-5-phosphate isomerase